VNLTVDVPTVRTAAASIEATDVSAIVKVIVCPATAEPEKALAVTLTDVAAGETVTLSDNSSVLVAVAEVETPLMVLTVSAETARLIVTPKSSEAGLAFGVLYVTFAL
jgi:type 1 fimbria pilin